MITDERKAKGGYYRVALIRTHGKQSAIAVALKVDYFLLFSTAGDVAGIWASDLPRPACNHRVSIQYIEAH